MPELPEVETVRIQLEDDLIGQVIRGSTLQWSRTLEGSSKIDFDQSILDQKITALRRRGKYLIIQLQTEHIVIHLRMTGRLYICDSAKGLDRWVRWSLHLDRKYLCFSDARKFGRIYLSSDLAELEKKLGPEPLTLSPVQWIELFDGQRAGLKSFLLNQKKLAGVGNIYADETLFEAKVHPLTLACDLEPSQARSLGATLQRQLTRAIAHEGSTISWYRKPDGSQGETQKHFQVYGKSGQPCPCCQMPLEKIKVAQRSTVFCPSCQRRV